LIKCSELVKEESSWERCWYLLIFHTSQLSAIWLHHLKLVLPILITSYRNWLLLTRIDANQKKLPKFSPCMMSFQLLILPITQLFPKYSHPLILLPSLQLEDSSKYTNLLMSLSSLKHHRINSHLQGCTRSNPCLPLQTTAHFTPCNPTVLVFFQFFKGTTLSKTLGDFTYSVCSVWHTF
jgi:hypothetical protein